MRRHNYHTVFTLTVILHVMWTLGALFSLSKMVLLSIDPVQGNFFPAVHSSISASYTAAGRQEENSTAVKIVCIEEMVNKNKTAEKQWNWKHPQTDVNVSGKWAQSKIQCFCSCLFKFLDYFLKTVACSSNHKGNIGWMFRLIKAVSHTQKYLFFFFLWRSKKKIFKFSDPQGFTLLCAEFNNSLSWLKWKLLCLFSYRGNSERWSRLL